jgi:hypothetical protein
MQLQKALESPASAICLSSGVAVNQQSSEITTIATRILHLTSSRFSSSAHPPVIHHWNVLFSPKNKARKAWKGLDSEVAGMRRFSRSKNKATPQKACSTQAPAPIHSSFWGHRKDRLGWHLAAATHIHPANLRRAIFNFCVTVLTPLEKQSPLESANLENQCGLEQNWWGTFKNCNICPRQPQLDGIRVCLTGSK